MSVEGRIVVDALFHDKDGTSAVNVLRLNSISQLAGGVVAAVTRTTGVGQFNIPFETYRNASGNISYPSAIRTVAFRFVSDEGACIVRQIGDNGSNELRMIVFDPNMVYVFPVNPDYPITVNALSTGTYSAVAYGDS